MLNLSAVREKVAKFRDYRSAYPVLVAEVRAFATTRLKQADLGGDQEAGFEQALASLGYAYMRDKAPQLIDKMVGFQLVDRSNDNKKAMGIFGFKMGPHWIYAPVFFLNGDLKGHELLYVKDKDLFVPLDDDWVNHLLSREPHVLGKGDSHTRYQLGSRVPNMQEIRFPPRFGKLGSDQKETPATPNWLQPFLPTLGKVAMRVAQFVGENPCDLQGPLSKDFGLLKRAWQMTQDYPDIADGFRKFYGADFFNRCTKALQAATKEASSLFSPMTILPRLESPFAPMRHSDPLRTGALQRFDVKTASLFDKTLRPLSDTEKSAAMRGDQMFRDERGPVAVSNAYRSQIYMALSNPQESGRFDVLERPDSFSKLLVIMQPHDEDGRSNDCVVVRTGDGANKSYVVAHPTAVWAKDHTERREEWRDWFDGLSDADLKVGATYMYVGPQGEGTCPFRVEEDLGDGAYEVWFRSYPSKSRPGYLPQIREDRGSHYCGDVVLRRADRQDTSIRNILGDLRIPLEYKAIQLEAADRRDGDSPHDLEDNGYQEKDEPIQLGDIADIQMHLLQKTSCLKIWTDGPQYVMRFESEPTQALSKTAAIECLVAGIGLKEATARQILEEAKPISQVYRVALGEFYAQKRAYGGGLTLAQGGGDSPVFPEPPLGADPYNGASQQYFQEEMLPVPGLSSGLNDPSQYYYQPMSPGPFDQTNAQAQQAAASGQKDVFDAEMLGGLLKSVSQESMVDRWLGDLIKGMDRLARIYFAMLWHREEFEDRYGKDTLPELEDSIRNAFESIGTVTLRLKEKETNPRLDLPSSQEMLQSVAEV